MNSKISLKSSFLVKAALFTFVLLCATTFTNAQGTTFAQFFQRDDNTGLNDFLFTNQCNTNGNATFNTIEGGSPILFTYLDVPNLPAELQGAQNARIYITSTTNSPATSDGDTLAQPINQTITIRIIRDTPTSDGVGTGERTNLLTAVITTSVSAPEITGQSGNNAAAFSASTPNQTIVYTSDFISFGSTFVSRNLSLSFSSLTPVLSRGACGFLTSFAAAGTGTFASNPGPTFLPMTAAGVSVSGRVLGMKSRTGLSGARVTLTNAAGESKTVLTNSSGYYRFDDVEVGQTVVISVFSKRYRYEAKAVNIGEELAELDFYPQ